MLRPTIINGIMVTIKKIKLTPENVKQLIELSRVWMNEDITNGLIENEENDLKEPCFAAFDGEKIIGYAFGHYYVRESKLSSVPVGSKCFELDELYVLKEYRSQGIGKALFEAMESEIKKEADYLTLPTSTKDYKRILHFYIEEMGMDFHSAFLTKKMAD